MNMGSLEIRVADLDDPRIVELLATHLRTMRAVSPPESVHALDIEQLRQADLSIWAVWCDGALCAIGALRRLTAGHGEIKSMHTHASARRRGAATALLAHILATARAEGLTRLSLETGSQPEFFAARALYSRYGFGECPPFGDYVLDPNSVFMTLDLGAVAGAANA
jgi:putative acetyltransferase